MELHLSVTRNNRGMTIIEMLLAMVILLIVALALMQSALIGMNHNVRNLVRDEAVGVADMRINQLTAKPFTDTELAATGAAGVVESTISRTVRKFPIVFTPTKIITDISGDTKQITISIAWSLKGQQYKHSMTTIMRKP